MHEIKLYLLRGVCQLPGYVAIEKGFFADEGIQPTLEIPATAWTVPARLGGADDRFAVIPWTRVAAAPEGELVAVCGSGIEEAAVVVRSGIEPSEVRSVAAPVMGGMKDLTAMGLLAELGWERADVLRQPSGDGAIIALFGQGVDAAVMVEPYATMFEALGVGRIVKRTGDLWPGAPGCSLATSARLVRENPELVQRVVSAYVRGAQWVHSHPEESSEIGARHIGVSAEIIRRALASNRPEIDAIRNVAAMREVLSLMVKLGYLDAVPEGFSDVRFLDAAVASCGEAAAG